MRKLRASSLVLTGSDITQDSNQTFTHTQTLFRFYSTQSLCSASSSRSEKLQVDSGFSQVAQQVQSGLSGQQRHHMVAVGVQRHIVRRLSTGVPQCHAGFTAESGRDTKRSCDIVGWAGQRHGATVRCRQYLSRTRALGRPSEPRAAASCRAEFFILRRRSSLSSVFFTSSNQTLIKKLRRRHCPLVAGCSIPHKPRPLCVSGRTKLKKLKQMFPGTVHVISADSHHVNTENGGCVLRSLISY